MKFVTTLFLTCCFLSIYAQSETEILMDGIVFPRFTTIDRDALTPIQGQCIYNIDGKNIECFDGSDWGVNDDLNGLNTPKVFPDIYSLFPSSGGIQKHDLLGNSTTVVPIAFTFEFLDEFIYSQQYLNGNIMKYDLDGNFISEFDPTDAGVPYYLDFVAIPDGRFALLDNQNDDIYILDNDGAMLQTIAIPNASTSYQNISGIVVEEFLFVSDNGNKEVIYVNLNTYDTGIFKDFSSLSPWLGFIEYANNLFYITTATSIYSFTLSGTQQLIATLPQGNITGLAIHGNTAYVINNGSDSIYEVDLISGTFSEFITGFTSNPRDIHIR